MSELTLSETDFKKWILFNNTLSDFKNLYNLYNAAVSRESFGNVTFTQEGDEQFFIRQDGVDQELMLSGESGIENFTAYISGHYFPNQDVESWYKSKTRRKDKAQNHKILAEPKFKPKPAGQFTTHPKEKLYYNLCLLFSVFIYISSLSSIARAFNFSLATGVIVSAIIAGILLFFMLSNFLFHGFLIGYMKGNAVKMNEMQYPEVFKIVKNQSEGIALSSSPDVYLVHGGFNSVVTKFARKKYLILTSELIETTLKGDYEVLKFVVGHELGHLKRRHLSKQIWLYPSLFIPFLGLAYSRACEYTCDRIGYHFSKQGSVEGMLILTVGKDLYAKINVDKFLEDSRSEDSFWTWFSEKCMSHPHLSSRLRAIKEYDREEVNPEL